MSFRHFTKLRSEIKILWITFDYIFKKPREELARDMIHDTGKFSFKIKSRNKIKTKKGKKGTPSHELFFVRI